MNTLDQYLNKLYQAADWGLADEREAWLRTKAYVNAQPDRYLLDNLTLVKAGLIENAHSLLANWFTPLYQSQNGDVALFDLNASPQSIWQSMVYMNDGIFAHGDDPLGNFLLTIPSEKSLDAPLLITPQLDGWGLEMK